MMDRIRRMNRLLDWMFDHQEKIGVVSIIVFLAVVVARLAGAWD
jgi:hypothetical protein